LPVARRRVVRGGALTVPGSGRGLAVAGRRGGLTVAGRGRRLTVAGCGGGLAVLGGRGRLVVARLVGLSRAVSGGARGQTAAGDRPGRRGGAVPGTRPAVLRRRLRRLVGGLLREIGLEVRALVLGRVRRAALRGRLLARGLLPRVRDVGGVI